LAWLDSPWVDWSVVVLALGIALRAHRGGYRLHQRCLPAGVAVCRAETRMTRKARNVALAGAS
jgi:hypothetical protein